MHYKAIENVIYKINGDGTLNLILYPYAKKAQVFTIPTNVKGDI